MKVQQSSSNSTLSLLKVSIHETKSKHHSQQRLLEMGIEVDERAFEGAFTPLQRASFCGHKDVVQLLLKRGAYVNTRSLDGKGKMKLFMFHMATVFFLSCLNRFY